MIIKVGFKRDLQRDYTHSARRIVQFAARLNYVAVLCTSCSCARKLKLHIHLELDKIAKKDNAHLRTVAP